MKTEKKVKQSRFPIFLFFVIFGIMLLMSGLHMGFIILMNNFNISEVLQTIVPILYWAIAAAIVTFYTRTQMKKTYENPTKALAMATAKVANGDFSVYVPTNHTADKYDYLDLMISDFNKMVEELGSIETLKTDFFSNVSHEIKTPIAVIQNNAELLQKESISIEQRKACTENIIYATRRLSSLISNMLKLNKLEKQSILPNLEYYDLPSQLCECALQFEEQWEKKNIEFDVDIEEEALIFADKELMEIVWTNLLSNALKFSDENGKITLKQFSKNNEVVVSIKDSGCGMDTKTLNRIFDKFYQGDTSRSTLGNGLGLALTKRILEMLNCSIYVESEINVGSEFIVTFHGEVETL